MGSHAKNYHDRFVRNVETEHVQPDEIWAFVGCKERRVPEDEKGGGRGDVWTFTAICRDHKLLIAYRVGNRDSENAVPFMDDLASRGEHVARRAEEPHDAHVPASVHAPDQRLLEEAGLPPFRRRAAHDVLLQATPHAHEVRGGMKTTPAMAAALTDGVWSVYDLLDLLDSEASLHTK